MNEELKAIWQQLEQRWQSGFEALMPEEQQTVALWWLEAETMNGTLNQYFWNTAGDQALIARAGLVRLRQSITRDTLDSALTYFGPDYPEDREQRMEKLEAIEAEHGSDVFTPASRIIQDLPEDFVAAALRHLATIYRSRTGDTQ